MTTTERIWMTRQQYTRLRNKLNALRSRLIVEVPDDFMDYDANRIALQRRIRAIQKLLTKAVVGENPAGNRIAEPGISPQAYERLQRELATLRELCTAAAANGDTDGNTTAVQRAWRARIQRIHDLLLHEGALQQLTPHNHAWSLPQVLKTPEVTRC